MSFQIVYQRDRSKLTVVDVLCICANVSWSQRILRDRHVSRVPLVHHDICVCMRMHRHRHTVKQRRDKKNYAANERNQRKKNSFSLASWYGAPAHACCTACLVCYAVMRVCLIHFGSSVWNEWNALLCTVPTHTNMQQHRLNTCIANHVLHNQNARAHTLSREHHRIALVYAGIVYFLFNPFSSRFGKIKIQKKNEKKSKKHENERRYESNLSFFSFQRSACAHVCVRWHTMLRSVRYKNARSRMQE